MPWKLLRQVQLWTTTRDTKTTSSFPESLVSGNEVDKTTFLYPWKVRRAAPAFFCGSHPGILFTDNFSFPFNWGVKLWLHSLIYIKFTESKLGNTHTTTNHSLHVGNQMIPSVIWNKFEDLRKMHEPVRRSALCSLWKIYECLIRERSFDFLLITYMQFDFNVLHWQSFNLQLLCS